MRTHLITPDGLLCGQEARFAGHGSSDLRDVDCKRCAAVISGVTAWQHELANERRRYERYRDAAHAVGLGEAWEWIEQTPETPTTRLLRGLVGSLALGLVESGFTTASDLRDTG